MAHLPFFFPKAKKCGRIRPVQASGKMSVLTRDPTSNTAVHPRGGKGGQARRCWRSVPEGKGLGHLVLRVAVGHHVAMPTHDDLGFSHHVVNELRVPVHLKGKKEDARLKQSNWNQEPGSVTLSETCLSMARSEGFRKKTKQLALRNISWKYWACKEEKRR